MPQAEDFDLPPQDDAGAWKWITGMARAGTPVVQPGRDITGLHALRLYRLSSAGQRCGSL